MVADGSLWKYRGLTLRVGWLKQNDKNLIKL